jgi:hypothetical protein
VPFYILPGSCLPPTNRAQQGEWAIQDSNAQTEMRSSACLAEAMRTFVDRHPLRDVKPAISYQIHLEAAHGIVDASGTLPLAHWVEDGFIYCALAAPDVEALCQHHTARSLACDEVHEIGGIAAEHPLSDGDRAKVLAEITRIWHKQ